MKRTRYVATLGLALLSACGGDRLSLGPDALNCRWVAVNEAPGMSLHLLLVTQNESVTGSGDWTGEAILGGDVKAAGQVTGRFVSLDLAFEPLDNGIATGTPFAEHFDGAFTSNNDIEGTTTQNGSQGQLHLQRLTGP